MQQSEALMGPYDALVQHCTALTMLYYPNSDIVISWHNAVFLRWEMQVKNWKTKTTTYRRAEQRDSEQHLARVHILCRDSCASLLKKGL